MEGRNTLAGNDTRRNIRSGQTLERCKVRSTRYIYILFSRGLYFIYRAIQNGANFLAEGFLFSVAASLIFAETWRSQRSQSKRRDDVDDRIDDLESRVDKLVGLVEGISQQLESLGNDVRAENVR